MNRWLFEKVLRGPDFKGKFRVLKLLRHGMRPYRATMKNGLEMELDCFEWAQLYLAQFGDTEAQTMALIQSLLRKGDCFVDVGAHVGYVSLVARKSLGAEGRVIAIEPQPYNCERILKNWEINGFTNLKLIVGAAGERGGTIELPQQAATDKSRLSLALPMHDATPLNFEVPMVSLKGLLERNGVEKVALLKIDVEGYESEVLEGLGEKAAIVENVVFEALSANKDDECRSRRSCDWLKRNNFALNTVTGERWDESFPAPDGNLWAKRILA